MAVQTTVTCDLTGKAIADGNRFPGAENVIAKNDNRSLDVTITIPEGVDVDRNALFTAIGNLAPKRTRTAKATAPEVVAGEPVASRGRTKPAEAAAE